MDPQTLSFEEEIARSPYNLKAWWRYLQSKQAALGAVVGSNCLTDIYVVYERSLRFLPRSYKLWHAYLTLRVTQLEHKCISSSAFTVALDTFERSLIHMHKMPRIWLDYCRLLVRMKRGTETRRAFDRALQALPVTQHGPIWEFYLEWVRNFGVEETAIRVYRRYLMFDSSQRESFVEYLEERGQYEEAVRQLAICVEDDHFVSPSGKSKHDIWMRLSELCSSHPEKIGKAIKVEEIIRGGIARFSDEVGRLWCRLADFYIRLGQFEQARDIYEEAIESVKTVRDFTIIFDAYIKVEESILTAKMQMLQEASSENGEAEAEDVEAAAEIDMRLARLEFMMEKRPLQLNSVVLRQNPHNVFEWQKRIKLFKDEDKRKLGTFYDAINAVDPNLAVGRLSSIWLALAKFYEKRNDLTSARAVWKKAMLVNYKSVDELAAIWCGAAEMEMTHENYESALELMERAVSEPTVSITRRSAPHVKDLDHHYGEPSSAKLHKNVKVWSLYLDLEESLGTTETCRAAYDRVMELKVITPQMALNFASFLEERDFFEDSFRVYERAVSMFSFPHVKKVWIAYLDKFMARYEGTKLERLRDMFEQAISNIAPEDAAEFYIKYAKAEESYGLARHAMAIYDRATGAVPENSQLDMYRLYIKKIEQHFGVTKTRPVYERAIKKLTSDEMIRAICQEYAEVERKLGEIDRSRAILQHGSQFADPKRQNGYWQYWREFEEAHGNEDTFRDMLRVKRSVEVSFSQVNHLAADLVSGAFVPAAGQGTIQDQEATTSPKTLNDLELMAENDALGGDLAGHKRKFVSAGTEDLEGKKIKSGVDSESIDIDEEDVVQIAQKSVPQAVFGSSS